MAASKVDTFDEALRAIADYVGKAKLVGDADLPFLIQLETLIIEKIRDPERRMQEAGILPPGQQGGLPGGGGGMGMSAPPPSFMGAGAPAGVQMAPGGPANAQEMQRVMSVPQ